MATSPPPGPGDAAGVQPLLAEASAYLADQGSLHLDGLDVSPELLKRRAAPVRPSKHAAVRTATAGAPEHELPAEVQALDAIRQHLGDCQRCPLSQHRTSIVFGTGDPTADLMLVGEAPGRDEDLQGEPFVGEAGRLLDRMLSAMGLARAKVYIANIIKCRPPKNRFPEPDEVARCAPFVRRQIAAVKPRVVVAMGRLAAHTLLASKSPISRLRGSWAELGEVSVMPTFHPAYLLRNPADKVLVWQDLQAVMGRLELPMPKRS